MNQKAAKAVSIFLTLFVVSVVFFLPAYAQMVRAAVTFEPITIGDSGFYRLDRNVSVQGNSGIIIRASNVTLDLNGFNVTASDAGITASGNNLQKIVVINGSVSAGQVGVQLSATNSRVEQVSITGLGARVGINVGTNSVVKNNIVSGPNLGIVCPGCIVIENTVNDSGDVGISASNASVVLGNRVTGSEQIGLQLDDTTGYANNVLSGNRLRDVLGGVQIGNNLCATSGICQ